jgi:DNA-directed RNA polymerase subunit L
VTQPAACCWANGDSDPQEEAVAVRKLEVHEGDTGSMELRVIEKEETTLSIEIAGEDHTFMNVLKGALLETEGVTAATYDMNPEQSGGQTEPVLTIKTQETVNALDALEDGAGRIVEKSEGFREAYRTA